MDVYFTDIMDPATLLFLGALSSYALAFVFFALDFMAVDGKRFPWGRRFVELGFLLHTLLIFGLSFATPREHLQRFYFRPPVAALDEVSSFFAWSLAFVYLVLLRRFKTETFGLVLAPVLVLFLIPTFFPFESNREFLRHFHEEYFLLHILSAFFGYAAFALSFIASILYLVLDRALKQKTSGRFYHKLPSLEDLEHLIFRAILWGILLLGVAIGSGALWTKAAFNSFILKEPKSFASLLTWVVYLVLVFLHEVLMTKGRRMVSMSSIAFLLVLFTFLGTSLFRPGLHVGAW